ncbi:hypothetical protein HPP92_013163 [Vanilla planifolia]|uniref:Uncharacterized protein n=1 Tax=Vanilla planifolia TaxID=51239 RepID=A0A835QYV8_VANPL|nr:hypothetical protein HPP92_013163 [Vanilla planifolia]
MGRPFSGGSSVKCYVDGEMVSSDKCRYAKVSDALTRCTIGTEYIPTIEGSGPINYEKVFPFVGQMGPIYMFCEALTAEQIKIIHPLDQVTCIHLLAMKFLWLRMFHLMMQF